MSHQVHILARSLGPDRYKDYFHKQKYRTAGDAKLFRYPHITRQKTNNNSIQLSYQL